MTTATKTKGHNPRSTRKETSAKKRNSNSKTDDKKSSDRDPQAPHPPKPEQVVADRILELLDQGELPPWEKGWASSKMGFPQNAVSKKPYRGINLWMTVLTQMVHGYQDPRWLTYRQANALGGHIRKGEKSTTVVFWKILREGEKKEDGVEYIPNPETRVGNGADKGRPEISGEASEGPDRRKKFPVCRAYHVFNIEQTEGCELEELEKPPAFTDPIQEAEAIIAGMPNPPAFETYNVANHPPHYSPAKDVIRVPERGRYDMVERYYNTIFHELTHSTGHESRLGRKGITNTQGMSHDYGVEELVAAMGSAMLSNQAGIEEETVESDAAYIRHWRDAIAADKSIVMTAAQQAQKAVDYILDRRSQPEEEEGAQPAPSEEPGAPSPEDEK